jgi:hypothetical protein
MSAIGAQRKCLHGSFPAAIEGIAENICSSRTFLRLTQMYGPNSRRSPSMCIDNCVARTLFSGFDTGAKSTDETTQKF